MTLSARIHLDQPPTPLLPTAYPSSDEESITNYNTLSPRARNRSNNSSHSRDRDRDRERARDRDRYCDREAAASNSAIRSSQESTSSMKVITQVEGTNESAERQITKSRSSEPSVHSSSSSSLSSRSNHPNNTNNNNNHNPVIEYSSSFSPESEQPPTVIYKSLSSPLPLQVPFSLSSATNVHPEVLRLNEEFAVEMERHRLALLELEDGGEEDDDDDDDYDLDDEDDLDDDDLDDENEDYNDYAEGYNDDSIYSDSNYNAHENEDEEEGEADISEINLSLELDNISDHDHEPTSLEKRSIAPLSIMIERGNETEMVVTPKIMSINLSPIANEEITPKATNLLSPTPAQKKSLKIPTPPPTTLLLPSHQQLQLLQQKHQDDMKTLIDEHRIFVKAVFQLLSDRDIYTTNLLKSSVNSTSYNYPNDQSDRKSYSNNIPLGSSLNNCDTFKGIVFTIIKQGTLKKASSHTIRAVWRTKYVQVRLGSFMYYDDKPSGASSSASNTPSSSNGNNGGFGNGAGFNNGVEDNGKKIVLRRRRSSVVVNLSQAEIDKIRSERISYKKTILSDIITANETVHKSDKYELPIQTTKTIINPAVTCRAVTLSFGENPFLSKVTNLGLSIGSGGGYVFEVSVGDGGPRRLFMCSSREERSSWIRAVHEGMVDLGCDDNDPDNDNTAKFDLNGRSTAQFEEEAPSKKGGVLKNSKFRESMESFRVIQKGVERASCREAYVRAIEVGISNAGVTGELEVPVSWIREKFEERGSKNGGSFVSNLVKNTVGVLDRSSITDRHEKHSSNVDGALSDGRSSTTTISPFLESNLNGYVQQLWKDMSRDSVMLNGELLKGDDTGPELIVGAFARCIINCSGSGNSKGAGLGGNLANGRMSELQAVCFARDILLACNRTRSGGDTYFCVDMLTRSTGLVVLCPHSNFTSPLELEISKATKETSNEVCHRTNLVEFKEKNGWLLKRSGGSVRKVWKRRYFVLSEGVLSYFERGEPRPAGLRGQVVLVGANLSSERVVSNENDDEGYGYSDEPKLYNRGKEQRRTALILRLESRDKSLEFKFEDEDEFREWETAISDEIAAFDDLSGAEIDKDKVLLYRDDEGVEVIDRNLIGEGGGVKSGAKEKEKKKIGRDVVKGMLKGLSIGGGGNGNNGHGNGNSTSEDESHKHPPHKHHDKDLIFQRNGTSTAENGSSSPSSSHDVPIIIQADKSSDHEGSERNHKSSIQVIVRASSAYKICTLDPQGDDSDTFVTLKGTFLQKFILDTSTGSGDITGSGFAGGRVRRGEEIVSVKLFDL